MTTAFSRDHRKAAPNPFSSKRLLFYSLFNYRGGNCFLKPFGGFTCRDDCGGLGLRGGRKGALDLSQAQIHATLEDEGQELESFMQKYREHFGRVQIGSHTNEKELTLDRRKAAWHILANSGMQSLLIGLTWSATPVFAVDNESPSQSAPESGVLAALTGDSKSLFNEGRAKEMQGNVAAAQRIYSKVTKISPKFIYGWSNLGNTQVVLGSLSDADDSYSRSISLCKKQLEEMGDQTFGVRRCDDLYLLLLNRGSVRLNNGMAREALQDLEQADRLRGKPDAVILQNRARARELNSLYSEADRDYTLAISMTSNEVAPFWLRSALVKSELGERIEAMDLIRRVENRFPEAPEVRAALAAMLWEKGDLDGARRKFLEIPKQTRLKFSDTASNGYMKTTISWPPAMIEKINEVAKLVGDQQAT